MHFDARGEQSLDVLPTLLVGRTGDIAVRELVDEHDLRPAGDDRVDVDLLPDSTAILDAPGRHDLEVADLRDRLGPAVGDDQADNDVGTTGPAPPTFVEHGVGLAHTGCRSEIDA